MDNHYSEAEVTLMKPIKKERTEIFSSFMSISMPPRGRNANPIIKQRLSDRIFQDSTIYCLQKLHIIYVKIQTGSKRI